MYRKESGGWLKHYDFILLDMICLQVAFVLAYAFSGYGWNPYGTLLYRNTAIFLELADVVVIFSFDTLKNVLKRGRYRDFVITVQHSVIVGAITILYLFLIQEGQEYSRLSFILMIFLYIGLTYLVREFRKAILKKEMEEGKDCSLMIITTKDIAENVVRNMQEHNYARYMIHGVAVIDSDMIGQEICGVPVVANEESAPMYICQEWIDEVLVVTSGLDSYP